VVRRALPLRMWHQRGRVVGGKQHHWALLVDSPLGGGGMLRCGASLVWNTRGVSSTSGVGYAWWAEWTPRNSNVPIGENCELRRSPPAATWGALQCGTIESKETPGGRGWVGLGAEPGGFAWSDGRDKGAVNVQRWRCWAGN